MLKCRANYCPEPVCPMVKCFACKKPICGPDEELVDAPVGKVEIMEPPRIMMGRPFIVDGEALASELTPSTEWSTESFELDTSSLSEAQARHLANYWNRAALDEHASVASFARFTQQLMAAGAPPELLFETQNAAADEVRHAKSCFGMANAFGSAVEGWQAEAPGPFPFPQEQVTGDFAQLAVAAMEEGCIGESLAVAVLKAAAAETEQEQMRQMLLATANDESRHASLACHTVQWAMAQGGAHAQQAVAQAFPQALALHLTHDDVIEPNFVSGFGSLSAKAAHQVKLEAVHSIVQPTMAKILNTTTVEECALPMQAAM